MCGIVGFTQKGWSSDPDRIRAATATLTHRGPDQQGVFSSRLCSLGATRLKILDLAAGDQPMTSSDGDTVIVFNGEIYNHLELRPELEALGYQFHTHCDTETVLYAFLAWDTACFARMRGMFAVALWRKSTTAPGSGSRPHGHQASLPGESMERTCSLVLNSRRSSSILK